MNPRTAWRTCTAVAIVVLGSATLAAEPGADAPVLSLERAVALALASNDPMLTRLEARAEALDASAVADAQLPDPMISSQLANVPTDTFALDQADMTQLRLGLRQEFPPGRTRSVRAEQRRSEAAVERARVHLALRDIALATREAWFELAYQQRAMAIVTASRGSVAQQIESLSARFATGRINAQDVLRAELELSLLEDRLAEHHRQAQVARAALARYLNEGAYQPLADDWPSLAQPQPLETLVGRLVDHPAVAVEAAQIQAADAGVALAEQAYRPTLALEGGYGVREERPDFASIGITVSLPLFTDNRQDRRHTAAVRQRSAEQLDRDALLLDLRRRLEQAWADWQRYDQRIELYDRAVREHARQTAEASVTTYANGQTDFAELIRSQLAELDTALKHVELKARAGQAWSRIVYLAGEPS